MKKVIFWAVMAWAARSYAETIPNPGLLDARIRTAAYSQDQVYRLKGFVGYQTDLEFENGETFVGLGAGDIEGISFVAQDNHLFLKPKAAKVGTNLTILTSRRTYQVDYSAVAAHPDASTAVIYALHFTYSPMAKAIEGSGTLHSDTKRPRNLNYWFCGDPSIAPIAAFDDGVHTHLRFAPKAEEPAIFIRNEDSSESLLNFSVEEGEVVVHRVARRLILRRGKLIGCVVNKGFAGAGERLKSNTVSEHIERAVREEHP